MGLSFCKVGSLALDARQKRGEKMRGKKRTSNWLNQKKKNVWFFLLSQKDNFICPKLDVLNNKSVHDNCDNSCVLQILVGNTYKKASTGNPR